MKPLAGRTILVTRAREQSGDLGRALADRGAAVVEAPVIAFEDPRDWAPADAALRRLGSYDFLIVTSANAADRFLARLDRLGAPRPAPDRPRVIAIGPATARALRARGLPPREVAAASRAEGLLALLSGESVRGRSVLIPRAEVAREVLPDQLRSLGAAVDVVTVYRTVPVPLTAETLRLIQRKAVDAVTFTSNSTVANLLAAVGGPEALRGIDIAVIGPVTAGAAREAGLEPTIVSAGPGVEELAEAIVARYASRS